MKRRPKRDARYQCTIHDHFGGSSNCVECGGPCRLTGGDLAATHFARLIFEHAAARGGWMGFYDRSILRQFGVDVDRFLRRAVECDPRTHRPQSLTPSP